MTARHPVATGVLCAAALHLQPAPAAAQAIGQRVTVEAVAAVSTTAAEPGDPMLIFDSTATVRVGNGLDLVVRPYGHRLPGGDWAAEMYQLQVRYVPPVPLRLRVDAGIIAEPIGQTSLELIPDRNPTIGGPFFYYAPLPPFSAGGGRVQVITPGYPFGVIVSASGERWDVRGGVIDQTPTRRRNAITSRRPAAAQLVVGGGLTPMPGLRVGAALVQGAYDVPRGLEATVTNVEVDLAAGYSRVAGEWIWDRFETGAAPASVHAFTAEAQHTLSPRWFAALRGSLVRAPVRFVQVTAARRAASAEATVGYRLTPELTLKAGYQASHWFYGSHWDGAIAVSAVVSRRWW